MDRFERGWTRSLDAYLEWFPGCAGRPHRRGVVYGLPAQSGSAGRIHEARPDARIVIVLRNPIDRAHSGHLHLIRDQQETESFERALELEDERRAAGWLPLFWHRQRSLYADPVSSFLERFGPERVLVLRFEDLAGDEAAASLRSLCVFLGVEPIRLPLPRANESGIPKSQTWQRVRRSDALRAAGRLMLGRRTGRALRERLISRNLKPTSGTAPAMRAALRETFAPDVQRLRAVLRDESGLWPEFSASEGKQR